MNIEELRKLKSNLEKHNKKEKDHNIYSKEYVFYLGDESKTYNEVILNLNTDGACANIEDLFRKIVLLNIEEINKIEIGLRFALVTPNDNVLYFNKSTNEIFLKGKNNFLEDIVYIIPEEILVYDEDDNVQYWADHFISEFSNYYVIYSDFIEMIKNHGYDIKSVLDDKDVSSFEYMKKCVLKGSSGLRISAELKKLDKPKKKKLSK